MAARASAAISELDDAMVRCSKDRRALVVQRVIELFLAEHGENIRDPGSLDDVLVCLIRRAELADLAMLSNALVRSRLRLPMALRLLAFHEDASVSVPILRHSPWVSEQDIRELAETRDQEHLYAISSRSVLSEIVSTTLVMRGNASVHVSVSRNLGARVSDKAFAILLKIAERDDALAEVLGRRPDIPASLVKKFLALVTGSPRAAFLKTASPENQALVEGERSRRGKPPSQTDYTSAEKEVGALCRTGKLTDSAVNRFAVAQEQEKLIAALALLSEAPIRVIERFLWADHADELIMACRAARLRWSTTASIIQHRQGGAAISEERLEAHRVLFERLSLSEAQWTIRFGQSDGMGGPPARDDTAKRTKHR